MRDEVNGHPTAVIDLYFSLFACFFVFLFSVLCLVFMIAGDAAYVHDFRSFLVLFLEKGLL